MSVSTELDPALTPGDTRAPARADPTRRTSRVAGILFLITFAASIPAVLLYGHVLSDPNYIIGAGANANVAFAAFLEIILAVAGIGTAVVLFPVVRRQNEGVGLGYIASRTLESTVIVMGAISLLSIVTLREAFAGSGGADAAAFVVAGKSLVAFHDWTFLLGPAFCAGIGNGLLLGWLMYRSGLVPKGWAILGLVGGTLAVATATAVLFGLYEQVSAPSFIATIPEIIWEGFLGFYLLFKGFKPCSIRSAYARQISDRSQGGSR